MSAGSRLVKNFLKKNFYITILAIAIIVGAFYFTGSYKSPELKALEASAAALNLQTGREIKLFIRDKNVVLGKVQYAEINLDYEPSSTHTVDDLYNEIISILESGYWKRDEVNVVPDFYSGHSTFAPNDFTALVSVGIDRDKNLVRVEFVNRNP